MAWGRSFSHFNDADAADDTPVIRPGEDEYALKMKYARAVFDLGNSWREAGFRVFPGPENRGRALQADAWYSDLDVQQEIERLRSDPTIGVMTREDIAREMATIMKSPTASNADKIKAAATAAEVMGFTKQPANTNINTGTITNNVLRVPAKPVTPEEEHAYEMRFKASQLKLVSDARASR